MTRKVNVVISNSLEALGTYFPNGESGNIRVLTRSPAVLYRWNGNVAALDRDVSGAVLEKINAAANRASQEIFEQAQQISHPAAITLARWPYRNHVLWLQAYCLRADIWSNAGVLLAPEPDRAELAWVLNDPLSELLAGNSNWEIRSVPVTVRGEMFPKPGFLQRLGAADWHAFGYRLFRALWSGRSFNGPRGVAYILRESEFVREAALQLAFRGFALKPLDIPAFESFPTEERDWAAEEIVGDAFDRYLAPLIEGAAVGPCRQVGLDRLNRDLLVRVAATRYWLDFFTQTAQSSSVVVLSNALMRAEVDALAQVCAQRGHVLALFQHGVTAEISDRVGSYRAIAENTTASSFYVFNPAAEHHHNANPMAVGYARSVGMPRQYRSMKKKRPSAAWNRTTPPIWYISTALYMGMVGLLHRGCTDARVAEIEISVIEKVLGRLPHRVMFKTYPGLKYTDDDPIILAAKRELHIRVENRPLDMRYLMKKARVLVTSNATSTLGWCLMASRPLIYIEQPEILPLNADVRQAMEKSVFFLDASDRDFFDNARTMLSRPIADIETDWLRKAPHRDAMIAKYFDDGTQSAGSVAALDMLALARSINVPPSATPSEYIA